MSEKKGFINNDPVVIYRYVQALRETIQYLLKERDEARRWARRMKRERDLWYEQAIEARNTRDNSSALLHEMNEKIYELRDLLYRHYGFYDQDKT